MSWFAIITTVGEEENFHTYIHKTLNLRSIYPRIERFFRVRQQDVYGIRPLVKGCVLVECDHDKNTLQYMLNQQSMFPIESITSICSEDIENLIHLLNNNQIIVMSKAYSKDHRAVVYEGPLKGNEFLITKNNAHKRLAELSIKINGKAIHVGLEIIEKR